MNWEIINTLKKYKKIVVVGGGTGGHIQPIISIIESCIDEHIFRKSDFLWIGWSNSSEEKVANSEKIYFHTIHTLKLSTTRSFKILFYPFVLFLWVIETRRILKSEVNKYRKADICTFSKWWPGSIAVGIASWSLGIDLYIHESDTIPGRSNILLWKIATKVFLGFESAKKYFPNKNIQVVWQIIHPIFWKNEVPSEWWNIQWKTELPHILVICGSQGAKSVFEAIGEQFQKTEDYEWIVALGKLNTDMKAWLEKIPNIQPVEWIEQKNIAHLLQKTDLTITRGSATTLAEIDSFWVRKIIIPLPYSASNHQYQNALEYEKLGDRVLEQKNIYTLSEIISQYFSDENTRKRKKTR